MADISSVEVANAHRDRMKAWGLPTGDRHEDDVVRRVLGTLRGDEEPPQRLSHAHEETGMCVDCDAAAVLVRLKRLP